MIMKLSIGFVGKNQGGGSATFSIFFPSIPSYLQHNLTFKGFHLDIESL